MVAGFKKKKIKSPKTLGDILHGRRRHKGFNLEQVESATHIRARFLQAIEKNNWDELPSDIYSRGYVESYALYLGLDKKELLERFDRERHLYRLTNHEVVLAKSDKPLTTMWLVTPKIFAVSIGLMIILSVATYIGFQVKSFSAAPELLIISPKSLTEFTVKNDEFSLIGKTSKDAKVEINGQTINVEDNGTFKTTVGLTKGENTFVVSAIGRNAKSKVELVTIEANY